MQPLLGVLARPLGAAQIELEEVRVGPSYTSELCLPSALAGGTILGDGRVGLILDLAGLFRLENGGPKDQAGPGTGPDEAETTEGRQ